MPAAGNIQIPEHRPASPRFANVIQIGGSVRFVPYEADYAAWWAQRVPISEMPAESAFEDG